MSPASSSFFSDFHVTHQFFSLLADQKTDSSSEGGLRKASPFLRPPVPFLTPCLVGRVRDPTKIDKTEKRNGATGDGGTYSNLSTGPCDGLGAGGQYFEDHPEELPELDGGRPSLGPRAIRELVAGVGLLSGGGRSTKRVLEGRIIYFFLSLFSFSSLLRLEGTSLRLIPLGIPRFLFLTNIAAQRTPETQVWRGGGEPTEPSNLSFSRKPSAMLHLGMGGLLPLLGHVQRARSGTGASRCQAFSLPCLPFSFPLLHFCF